MKTIFQILAFWVVIGFFTSCQHDTVSLPEPDSETWQLVKIEGGFNQQYFEPNEVVWQFNTNQQTLEVTLNTTQYVGLLLDGNIYQYSLVPSQDNYYNYQLYINNNLYNGNVHIDDTVMRLDFGSASCGPIYEFVKVTN